MCPFFRDNLTEGVGQWLSNLKIIREYVFYAMPVFFALLLGGAAPCSMANDFDSLKLGFNILRSDTLAGNQFSQFQPVDDIAIQRSNGNLDTFFTPYNVGIFKVVSKIVKGRFDSNLTQVPAVIEMPVDESKGNRGKTTDQNSGKSDNGSDDYWHMIYGACIGYVIGLAIVIPLTIYLLKRQII